jgi:hypothetical protein
MQEVELCGVLLYGSVGLAILLHKHPQRAAMNNKVRSLTSGAKMVP